MSLSIPLILTSPLSACAQPYTDTKFFHWPDFSMISARAGITAAMNKNPIAKTKATLLFRFIFFSPFV
jgi:hypothetical protein